jgi:hypothetical protein
VKTPQTQIGDVLILQTGASFTIYAVGLVERMDQVDFQGQDPSRLSHVPDYAGAVTFAKTLLAANGRVFVRNIDSDRWSEVAVAERASGQVSSAKAS